MDMEKTPFEQYLDAKFPQKDKLYTTEEMALMLNRKVRTLYKWVREGRMVVQKDMGGQLWWTYDNFKSALGIAPGRPTKSE